MMVILIGAARADMIKIKRKDYGKHFMSFRGQLYKVFPDGLTKCYTYRWGERKADEELIVYKENAIIPYHPRRI